MNLVLGDLNQSCENFIFLRLFVTREHDSGKIQGMDLGQSSSDDLVPGLCIYEAGWVISSESCFNLVGSGIGALAVGGPVRISGC